MTTKYVQAFFAAALAAAATAPEAPTVLGVMLWHKRVALRSETKQGGGESGVLKKGWLNKQRDFFKKSWPRRWFQLEEGSLKYWETEADAFTTKPKRTWDLIDMTVERDGARITLEAYDTPDHDGERQKVYLEAPNGPAAAQEWENAIEEAKQEASNAWVNKAIGELLEDPDFLLAHGEKLYHKRAYPFNKSGLVGRNGGQSGRENGEEKNGEESA